MSPSPTTIKLAPRRLEQLKAIASAHQTTVTEALANFIREQIKAGIIADSVPGVIVKRMQDSVSISIDDAEAAIYSREIASKIASTLKTVSGGGSGVVDIDHNFGVVRQGTGIKVMLPLDGPGAPRYGEAPSFPPDLAIDLARIIEKAAK